MRPLALLGTTASGKSALAMELARQRGDVELVSVDSMQVYRGMDIGTAKPTAVEQAEVRHHVIDLVDPWEPFEVHSFQVAVAAALADIAARGKQAVLVGGTGMYLRAVIDGFEIPGRFPDVTAELEATPDTGPDTAALHQRLAALDPLAASRMEPSNRRRVVRALSVTLGSGQPFSSFGPGFENYPPTPVCLFGLWVPRPVNVARIEERYQEQLEAGFVDEVRRLAAGPSGRSLPPCIEPIGHTAAQALGYRELLAHVRALEAGESRPTIEEAITTAVSRTRQFARRQRSWFRRDPRITWVGATTDPLVGLPALKAQATALWGNSQ